MDILALFSDGSHEKIIISPIAHKDGEKGLILRSTIKDRVLKESAEHVITNTYNYLLMKFPNNPLLLDTISICILGFSGKIVGNSAELAFSMAFISHLVQVGILKVSKDNPSLAAATGTVNDRLEIGRINNLENKIFGIKGAHVEAIYLPQANFNELALLPSTQTFPYIRPVQKLDDILFDLGIIEGSSSEESPSRSPVMKDERKNTDIHTDKHIFSKSKFPALIAAALILLSLAVYGIYRNTVFHEPFQSLNTESTTGTSDAADSETTPVSKHGAEIDITPDVVKNSTEAEENSVSENIEEGETDNTPISVNWDEGAAGEAGILHSIAYGNGVFIAAGEGIIKKSVDGKAWTKIKTNMVSTIRTVRWLKGNFYALGYNGMMLKSKDGIEWTQVQLPSAWNLLGIAHSGKIFVAVGGYGTVITSPDGISWALAPKISDDYLCGVAWGNGRFITVDYSGKVYTSPDGSKWTNTSSILGLKVDDIRCIDGKYYAFGDAGAAVSKDAVSWEPIFNLIIGEAINSIIKIKGTYIAAGSTGALLTSLDGIEWKKTAQNIKYFFVDTAYSKDVVVAAGYIVEESKPKILLLRGKITSKK